jgi:hypothetical protein
MPQMVVAFWNCTKSEHWSETSFQKRITSLYAATFTAQIEADSKMGKQSRVSTWIFTAPEYAFAQDQVSLTSKTQVEAALSQITSKYGSLLLIPGTIAVKDAANYAQNLCYAYNYAAGGEQIKPYKKETSLGEDIYYFLINL